MSTVTITILIICISFLPDGCPVMIVLWLFTCRLQDMCEQFMGEVGEMKIYKQYKKNPKSRKRVEDLLCRGKGQLGNCRGVDKDKPSKDEL